MNKILAISLVFFLVGCGSIRFVGEPLVVNPLLKTKTVPLTEDQKKQWHLLDLEKDSIPGTSVLRAYKQLLQNKSGERIIVAIIDSGVDTSHSCLEDVVWVNEDEIENNGIDDDKNGFVDDRHGWNFLGSSDKENMEYVRLMKITDPSTEEFNVYASFLNEDKSNVSSELLQINALLERIKNADSVLSTYLGTKDYSLQQAKDISPKSPAIIDAIRMKEFLIKANILVADVEEYLEYLETRMNFHFNIDFEGRLVVGDNPNDLEDRHYGDANVVGPSLKSAEHGTHVAGIIAGVCGQKSIFQGVAQNLELMIIRAVPDGDEYDKDVALAIRYAVDNGARVINTSFGKDFSPHQEWVFDALRYAESKDVLIVNAAGNDNKNIDFGASPSYPTDQIEGVEFINNFLTVGATDSVYSSNQVASFSNFGASAVDIFAPGSKIYSTVPGEDYKYLSGTSMAAPNVAGIAAVLRSFFPSFSAATIKKIILDSGVPLFQEVIQPENKLLVSPNDLSNTGKMANLYNALLLASKTKKK